MEEKKKWEVLLHADLANGAEEGGVEGGGGEDGLREAGGAGDERREAGAGADVGDAVQRLRPPLVRRDPQPRQRRLLVHQEPHLLRQRQPPQQLSLVARQLSMTGSIGARPDGRNYR
ncbi:hypothetical protein OsJ_16369 [Oryza sativa Japonica Group]|uniref:Uncharacterized protein n=1 Tax=Oryza sativa subsp. japonica TaxID=39947 RepID=A3AXX5_ORYSJ|nr:hypothetical protein OsJ_16369 [Oryza sativa Japonica Group]